jgi:hypothetical protein
MKTYNVHFNDSNNSNDLGLSESFEKCKSIISFKQSEYFADYIGGTVSIVCNETSETEFELGIELTSDFIKRNGVLIDSNAELQCQLYSYRGCEYVILCDNSLITRQEDNSYGLDDAIFPY